MKSMVSLILCIIVILSLMVGCSSTPKVRYGKVQPKDYDGKIKFNLSRSLIKLDLSKCGKDEQKCTPKVEAVSMPAEHVTDTYTITPQYNMLLKTHLKVTYIDNTRLISSIGSEIEDNRIKAIQAVGAGLAAIVAFKVKPEELVLPVVIDVDEYRKQACGDNDICKWIDLPSNENRWCYKIDFGDTSKDVIKADEFFNKYSEKEADVMIYSACRDATLWVSRVDDGGLCATKELKKFDAEKDFVAKLKVADPNYVQTIKFPEKGKIDMHSSCGANVTNEKTESTDMFSVISEILKQAKSIKEAQDKKK